MFVVNYILYRKIKINVDVIKNQLHRLHFAVEYKLINEEKTKTKSILP